MINIFLLKQTAHKIIISGYVCLLFFKS